MSDKRLVASRCPRSSESTPQSHDVSSSVTRARSYPACGLLLLALIGAVWTGAAGAGTASDVCAKTGVTTAFAVSILGKGAYAEPVANYTPPYCAILPASNDGGSWYISIVVYPKSQFKAQLAGPGTRKSLSGLGVGAISIQGTTIVFQKGAYAVHIGASFVISSTKVLKLAHAIYAHLT